METNSRQPINNSGNKTGLSNIPSSFQHGIQSTSHSNKAREEDYGTKIRKEVKLSPFAEDIILYIKHPKYFIRKLLETIDSISKVAGYKISLHNSVAFLYTFFFFTIKKHTEKEIMETAICNSIKDKKIS